MAVDGLRRAAWLRRSSLVSRVRLARALRAGSMGPVNMCWVVRVSLEKLANAGRGAAESRGGLGYRVQQGVRASPEPGVAEIRQPGPPGRPRLAAHRRKTVGPHEYFAAGDGSVMAGLLLVTQPVGRSAGKSPVWLSREAWVS